ncbi:diacylglycerol kinase family protein [soil metagenome]
MLILPILIIQMKLIKSFGYAWDGILYCIKTQLNFRIHFVLLTCVIVTGLLLKVSNIEWLVIILCSILVLTLEMINTALEYVCNLVTNNYNPAVKIIKDVAAGAVLVSAIGSVVIALIIFLPKIVALLN